MNTVFYAIASKDLKKIQMCSFENREVAQDYLDDQFFPPDYKVILMDSLEDKGFYTVQNGVFYFYDTAFCFVGTASLEEIREYILSGRRSA